MKLQGKIGLGLASLGAMMMVGGGIGVFSGAMTLKHFHPSYAGTALLMEVVGLGMTEKNRDC